MKNYQRKRQAQYLRMDCSFGAGDPIMTYRAVFLSFFINIGFFVVWQNVWRVQSDREKEEGLPVAPFMDREKVTKPTAQIGFIKFVLLPMFETIAKASDSSNIFAPFDSSGPLCTGNFYFEILFWNAFHVSYCTC